MQKKTTKHKRGEYAPHVAPEGAPMCHMDGCMEAGTYKAPKSREELHEYRWFCLDHVREHNKQWDYFAGLGSDEIEYFIRDAVTGHRPTWERDTLNQTGGRIDSKHYFKLQEALYAFLNGQAPKAKAPMPPLSGKLRKALALMDIEYPYTEKQLKIQYRAMVKKYHPDMNKGDKQAEETFKQVTAAYNQLAEHIKPS